MDEEHEENWDIPVPSAEDGISKKQGGGSIEDMDIGDDSNDNLSMDEMTKAGAEEEILRGQEASGFTQAPRSTDSNTSRSTLKQGTVASELGG
jgi:hypothetical protein